MSDHNKEIRNLTESVNNLYEQGGWPGGSGQIGRSLWHLFLWWQFQRRMQKILDGGGLKGWALRIFMMGCDMGCLFQMWLDAGQPSNFEEWLESLTNPSDDDDVTPDDGGGGGTDTKPPPPIEYPKNWPPPMRA